MRSFSTAATAATAAALAALAVTVAVPALGDNGGSDKPVQSETGPDEATIRACLADHGAAVPDGDGYALKRWIVSDHSQAEKDALQACGMSPDVKPTNKGPRLVQHDRDEATIRACLADHGATVPDGDGYDLKRWVIGDHSRVEQDALNACGMAPAPKPGADGGPVACTAGPARGPEQDDGAKAPAPAVRSGTQAR